MWAITRDQPVRIGVALCLAAIAASTGWQLLETADSAVPAVSSVRLIAHWPLSQDARDVVGTLDGQPKNIEFGRGTDGSKKSGAFFNGRNGMIEINDASGLEIQFFHK